MKRIIIKKEDTKCSDVVGYTAEGAEFYSWKAFCKYIKDPCWLNFSIREVIPQVMNEKFVIIDIQENLVDNFLDRLCEASSIDFSFYIVK